MIVTAAELNEAKDGMTRAQCLNEAADRAMYFYRQTGGSYRLPNCDPQTKQVLELLFTAST